MESANLEKLRELLPHLEKATVPGDLQEKINSILTGVEKTRGAFPGASEQQLTKFLEDGRRIQQTLDKFSELTSRAETVRSQALQVASLITAKEIRQLKSKIPIFLKLVPTIDSLPTLLEKCQRLLVLVREVEALNE